MPVLNSEVLCSDEDVVITGMSGRLPECNSIDEFSKYLFEGVDLVTADDRRWPKGFHGLPQRCGKLKNLELFDAAFFKVHPKQSHVMDPQVRILLEATYEAIIDAGMNPTEMSGSRTGVFVGATKSESFELWSRNMDDDKTYVMTGCSLSMFSNRVSYAFNFQGPSISIDTACSSSLVALSQAWSSIRGGYCDAAIVAGTHLCLIPETSLNLQSLGVLKSEGNCQVFDESADGYVRSEAVVALLLQNRGVARRVYATVLNARSNNDGYKENGITFPSGDLQKRLIEESFQEINVDPAVVSYVEAHGTGTKAGDVQEVNALADVFCRDRSEPLLVGSVKSNIGHTETTSGMCSILKILLAMEEGVIPANLHFQNPRKDIPALIDGRIKVVDKNTEWEGGIAAINSFGFGGTNAHVILKSECLEAPPSIKNGLSENSLPRLVLASGRTEQAVRALLEKANQNEDQPFFALLNAVHSINISGHPYRGYSISNPSGPAQVEVMELKGGTAQPSPVWFVFSGLSFQWTQPPYALLNISVFAASIQKCASALQPLDIDLFQLLDKAPDTLNIIHSLVYITAVQVALVDVFHAVGIRPDGMIGHCFGDIGCAYADNGLTAEQAVLVAYWRGRCIQQAKLSPGAMAAVNMSWDECRHLCSPDIVLAAENSPNDILISGPFDSIKKFVSKLQSQNIGAHLINSCGVAANSQYGAAAVSQFQKALELVILEPKRRSSNWISSPIQKNDMEEELIKTLVNNMVSPVQFAKALLRVPPGSVVVDMAPHELIHAVMRRSLPSATVVPLIQDSNTEPALQLLTAIGKLYTAGAQPNVRELYPSVLFPVPRGTPRLASLVHWDHSMKWDVADFTKEKSTNNNVFKYNVLKPEDKFISGHKIDGKVEFPASGYLVMAWKSIAKLYNGILEETGVILENVQILEAITIPPEGSVKFNINILQCTGEFEISEGRRLVAKGSVKLTEDHHQENLNLKPLELQPEQELPPLSDHDIHNEQCLRGYEYTGLFNGFKKYVNNNVGILAWKDNWITFIDTMLQFDSFEHPYYNISRPIGFSSVVINPFCHRDVLQNGKNDVPIFKYRDNDVIKAGGVKIHGIKYEFDSVRARSHTCPRLEKHLFVSYHSSFNATRDAPLSKQDALVISLQIVIENICNLNLKVAEAALDKSPEELLAPILIKLLELQPKVKTEFSIACGKNKTMYEKILKTQLPGAKTKDLCSLRDKNHLIIAASVLARNDIGLLSMLVDSTNQSGFILLEEKKLNLECSFIQNVLDKLQLCLVCRQETVNADYILLRRCVTLPSSVVVHVSVNKFSWVSELKKFMKEATQRQLRIYIAAMGERINGALGLVTCLRDEPGGEAVRLYFLPEATNQIFTPTSPDYVDQVRLDLAVNVQRLGQWGCYRHLYIDEASPMKQAPQPFEHVSMEILNRGGLASLQWTQSPLHYNESSPQLCSVYYAAINISDYELATGIPRKIGDLTNQNYMGLEFSGKNRSGQRVMGIVPGRGVATTVIADPRFLWKVPDSWTLEQAATVPLAYATAFYSLVVSGRIRYGETILVHEGTNDVGQAAISIALHAGCRVITTVGSSYHRGILLRQFPQLQDEDVMYDCNTSFEQCVLGARNGRGVDLLLTSECFAKATTTDWKSTNAFIRASIHCLARGGRFIQIGKLDMSNNTDMNLTDLYIKNGTFRHITLDTLLTTGESEDQKAVVRLMDEGLASGVVRPLSCTVYSDSQLEFAFCSLAWHELVGKALLKLCDDCASPTTVCATPRTYFHSEKSYVVCGGLGALGLQLAEWLIRRGARRLVLAGREGGRGLQEGGVARAVRRMRATGAEVVVRAAREGRALLREAATLGPVGGVFNLAAVLRDRLAVNLSEDDFREVVLPKVDLTQSLDVASRELAPSLDHFVVFSSLSCGRGNAGQSNYGYANSAAERICELRHHDGLPGLAIQWGGIAGVGIFAKKPNRTSLMAGTVPQCIASFLETLDIVMSLPYPVISSTVPFDKQVASSQQKDVTDLIANVMGMRNISEVLKNTKLLELGIDSIMGFEIKQTLETNYNILLSFNEIGNLTLNKIQQMTARDDESE